MTKKKPKELLEKRGPKNTYKPKYADMLIKFFTEKEPHKIMEDGKRFAASIPTIEKFCVRVLGISVSTFHVWRTKFPELQEAYLICKDIQKEFVFENGTLGLYNSDFTKFFAKNCLGMVDKVEQEVTGKDGKPLEVQKIFITPQQQQAVNSHIDSVLNADI